MANQELEMNMVYKKGTQEHYVLQPVGIAEALGRNLSAAKVASSLSIYDESDMPVAMPITVDGKAYNYVRYGGNDSFPQELMKMVSQNLVIASCLNYNAQCAYGQGVRFVNREDRKDTDDEEVRDFCLRNSIHRLFMEQVTDMKTFGFAVMAVILSRDGKRIVQLRHKDVAYCRFEEADSMGRINHVFYGDFRPSGLNERRYEALPLLDPHDPLGDLRVRMGLEPDPLTGKLDKPTAQRAFAVVTRIPVPGSPYYPMPSYLSIFKDNWYDIYTLIGQGKKYMIKNTSAPRIQIEVHQDYWGMVCDQENIIDPEKRMERINQEKRNIVDFVCGPENAGKALISGYYIDVNGKEARMVRVYNLNASSGKEGGDWSEDSAEASNFICFAMGVHPNLVGATPGKSQMNNSGSDKRELFTLKQVMEKPIRDLLSVPYHLLLHYNGWDKKGLTVDVPMLVLTTLDENKDQKKVSVNNRSEKDESDDNNKTETNND